MEKAVIVMPDSFAIPKLSIFVLFLTLFLASSSPAQNSETKGIDSGDYHIQQTVDLGYRSTWINGNVDTYDTFVNLGQGPRLFGL